MKNLNPSNSIIKVDCTQMIEGNFETVMDDCTDLIKNNLSTDGNFLIGHISEEWFRPRMKGYEKHKGLKIKIIVAIYRCQLKSIAHNMESYLISQFKSIPQNRNIRNESHYKGHERNEPYFVYLAKE